MLFIFNYKKNENKKYNLDVFCGCIYLLDLLDPILTVPVFLAYVLYCCLKNQCGLFSVETEENC